MTAGRARAHEPKEPSTMSDDLDDFRSRAKAFLAENGHRMTSEEGEGALFDTDNIEWQRDLQAKIFDAGFAGITWPKAYGGQGLTDAHQLVWNEESAPYKMPAIFGIGFGMAGPTIVDLGTEEQKQRYIPKLLRGEEIWCQLFSEPGAGSDVAGLSTKAERDGDEWVVNGQKVWTSGAHRADLGILIARTDPSVPKHNGITMFVVSMRSPGLTIRPLKQATGEAPFNEEFFDNVRIPGDSVVGEVNAGWAAAVLMLRHERISIGTNAKQPSRPLSYASIKDLAAKLGRTDDPLVRDRLAYLYATDTGQVLLAQRMRQEVDAGIELRARGSIPKLAGSMMARIAVDVVDEVAGYEVAAWEGTEWPSITYGVVRSAAFGIEGGSNEIQRGIIGERVLGLAKDPQLDREIPFQDLRKIPPARTASK
ncbi:MAG: dehydrogenase [Jatrophihabitantaceae bacterium]|nr:dehydrogenase [Jatrophihabitantaceae bacterium]